MMKKQWAIIGSIIILSIASCSPSVDRSVKSAPDGKVGRELPDGQGGSQLTIQLKPTAEHPQITPADIDDVKKTIDKRINGLGISNAIIQSAGIDRVIVKLPGIKEPQQAARVLGGTAQLEFREQKLGTEGKLNAKLAVLSEAKLEQMRLKKSGKGQEIAANQAMLQKQYMEISKLFNKAIITGNNIRDARAEASSPSGWGIAIEFDKTGSEVFTKLTKNLAGTGRSIGIFLDNEPISTPTVGANFATVGITGGNALIAGDFTAQQANDLAIQLRGGSFPLPVEIVESRTY